MTILKTMENLLKISKTYEMDSDEEQETILYAIGYLENLKVFIEKIEGVSEDWKERAVGNEIYHNVRKQSQKDQRCSETVS